MGLGRACPPLLSLSRPGGYTPGRVANPIVREGLVLIVLRGKGQAEGYESRRRERAMSLAEEISNVLELKAKSFCHFAFLLSKRESLLTSAKHGLPMGHS